MSTKTSNSDILFGRCKWFNNKTGYGFLTVVQSNNKNLLGNDVFAHHSAIVVGSEQYKYLVQGEYVAFTMEDMAGHKDGEHSVQASDITGIGRGPLMCETRHEARKLQEQNRGDDPDGTTHRRRNNRPVRKRNTVQVRLKGEGPRDGEAWTHTHTKTDSKHADDTV